MGKRYTEPVLELLPGDDWAVGIDFTIICVKDTGHIGPRERFIWYVKGEFLGITAKEFTTCGRGDARTSACVVAARIWQKIAKRDDMKTRLWRTRTQIGAKVQ